MIDGQTSPPPERSVPAFEREPEINIPADAAQMPVPSDNGAEVDLHQRIAELATRFAASQAGLAEAVERRHRAEEALANTQLEHLRAMRRIEALERNACHDHAVIPDAPANGTTQEPAADPVAPPPTADGETPSVSTALMTKIAHLREAIAVHAPEADDDDVGAEIAPPEPQGDVAGTYRDRLTRAAEARRRPAS